MKKSSLLKLVISAVCLGVASATVEAQTVVQAAAMPEKLRVLSVDLGNVAIVTEGSGSEATHGLKQWLDKADPDVICLQGVRDWETSARVAELRPGFRVLICSGFTVPDAGAMTPQVAILAKDRAILSWVEELSDGQAFAFALVQAGSRKLGIFSVQSSPALPGNGTPATPRVLAEVRKLQQFPQNRPDAMLVMGTWLANHTSFIEAGFQTATLNAPAKLQLQDSAFWAWQAGFLSVPRAVAVAGLKAPAIVADFDAVNAFSSKFAYQNTLTFAGESPARLAPAAVAPSAANSAQEWLWPIAILFAGVLLGVIFFSGKKKPGSSLELVPAGSSGQATPVAPVDDSLRGHLIAWLKTTFVQRLLSQRQQLLTNEDEATRRTLAIEEKLTALQSSLQERISAYESRILRLEDELSAATSENRDLIRGQIDLLKEKLVQAREEHAMRRN